MKFSLFLLFKLKLNRVVSTFVLKSKFSSKQYDANISPKVCYQVVQFYLD